MKPNTNHGPILVERPENSDCEGLRSVSCCPVMTVCMKACNCAFKSLFSSPGSDAVQKECASLPRDDVRAFLAF